MSKNKEHNKHYDNNNNNKHQPSDAVNQQPKNDSNKPNKRGGLGGFFLYNWNVAKRFYGKMIQEGVLAAILTLPFYLYLHYTGVEKITLTPDFMVLWGIVFILFTLQSFMFGK